MGAESEANESTTNPKIGWSVLSCSLGLTFLASLALLTVTNQYMIDEYNRTGTFQYPPWFWVLMAFALVAQVLVFPGVISGVVGFARALPGLKIEEIRGSSILGIAAALFGIGSCGWGVYVGVRGIQALATI
ncbi:hypothetical protein PLCT2_00531 [Planctomycetaceae bacterium]|nr:hypothetical protein PLCT2_00531 [Planctomycetaceae bacterium]